MKEVLAPPGSRVIMLGNVAIARGALEYGVAFASAYPGTPSTEITEALSYASRLLGAPYVEWSSNEKVALEGAIGAALAGVPAMASMKHVGVNVAADPLFSVGYMGVPASLVIVSADDPGMWSSQNEQDNRIYGIHAYIPVVEPAGAQEAKRAVIEAFKLSEKWGHPVILRSTTRIGHTRVPVETGEINLEGIKRKGKFEKNTERYTLVPAHARKLREELVEKWERIREDLASHPLNWVEGPEDAKLLVVGAGLGYRYAKEALARLGLEDKARLLKIGTPVPLPRKLIVEEASRADKIFVVEEGDPVVESQIKEALYDEKIIVDIHGKEKGPIRRTGELTLDNVTAGLARVAGVPYEAPQPPRPRISLPPRPPVLCAGCPYRAVFYALRRAVGKARVRPIYNGDIGCYSLGVNPPFQMQDTIVEMGGSIGLANGMSHTVEGQIPIAIIGDSTFFHAGLPGLANAVYNRAPMLVVVLDNRTTAMTGHQPHPGIGVTARGEPGYSIDIVDAARGLGVEYVKVIDAFNIKEGEEEFYKALEYVKKEGKPALVVARGACILLAIANARRMGVKYTVYTVDLDKCTACGLCYKAFNCPAIYPGDDGKARIDPLLCTGCGECAQICPFDAFHPVEEPPEEWLRIMRTAKPM
ncbi:MAG: indolepyruvate ferredoxin oxidoreductase subunit alpha [Desulfurococcales archaeon]|nr:indolepyruvate ferredoxin oxidoreductase subunit alpha [Desulfurococcales archaeon]